MSDLLFSWDDANEAFREWGCNCGPAALAFVLGITLDDVRPIVERCGFDVRRYMSPTMMQEALDVAKVKWREPSKCRKVLPDDVPDRLPEHGLVRVQWTGPWTAVGANPRWAYGYTHWFAASDGFVFDINCGLVRYDDWLRSVPPSVTETIKRADGGWYATHIWEIGVADVCQLSGLSQNDPLSVKPVPNISTEPKGH